MYMMDAVPTTTTTTTASSNVGCIACLFVVALVGGIETRGTRECPGRREHFTSVRRPCGHPEMDSVPKNEIHHHEMFHRRLPSDGGDGIMASALRNDNDDDDDDVIM